MIIEGSRSMDRATELVLRYYSAFNRGDWDAMLACLADDVAHDINQGVREIGLELFRAFLARMQRSHRMQLRDLVVMANAEGTRAAAEYVVHGEYLADFDNLPPAPRPVLCAARRRLLRHPRRPHRASDQLLQPRGSAEAAGDLKESPR
jgi:steroid delta-isomerase-like uncharacterized protein